MIDKIQIIIDVLGVVSCAILLAYTGEIGYLLAMIWATTAFTTHLTHLND